MLSRGLETGKVRGARSLLAFRRGVLSKGPDPETQAGKTSRGWGHEHDNPRMRTRDDLTFLL